MKNFFSSLTQETRRIRWSSLEKTTKAFVYTLITVFLITTIIVLFSWGVTSLISAMTV